MILDPYTGRSLTKVAENIYVWIKNPLGTPQRVQLVAVPVPSRLLRVYEVQDQDGELIGWGFEPLTPEVSVQGNALCLRARNAPQLSNSIEFQHDYIVEDWHLFEYDSKYAVLVVLPDEDILHKLEP